MHLMPAKNALSTFEIRKILTVIGIILILNRLLTWLPRWSIRLVERAANRLPVNARARYLNDWQAELECIPGGLGKIRFAVDLFRGVTALAKEIAVKPVGAEAQASLVIFKNQATALEQHRAVALLLLVGFLIWIALLRIESKNSLIAGHAAT
jgi:hypothetical protein